VDRRGVASDHHFILSHSEEKHQFDAGDYTVELFANCVGIKKPLLLSSELVRLSVPHATAINNIDVGIFFDWNPELGTYEAVADPKRTAELAAIRENQIRALIKEHI
jgi:hypothetical protein